MKYLKKYLPNLLFISFFGLAILAFISSKPTPKNERIYKVVQHYSPYYLEKRLGGFTIKNKEDKKFKKNPNNMTLFHEFERLEKHWAKNHLKLSYNTLIVLDNNQSQRAKLTLKTSEEFAFVKNYYEIH